MQQKQGGCDYDIGKTGREASKTRMRDAFIPRHLRALLFQYSLHAAASEGVQGAAEVGVITLRATVDRLA